jgi:hypothetical protein
VLAFLWIRGKVFFNIEAVLLVGFGKGVATIFFGDKKQGIA